MSPDYQQILDASSAKRLRDERFTTLTKRSIF